MRKRLLSLILATAMILSFVPVYSSAEDETELSGAKIVYEFQQVGKSYNSTLGTDITAYTYDHTNGFWQGAFVHNIDGRSGMQGPHMNASYGLFMRYVGSWAAIKINVPASGVYNKLSLRVHSIANASTDIDVYIAPASTELSDSLDVTTLPVLAQNVDISKLYAQNSANTLGIIDTDINKYIAAGEYYLVFKVEGGKYADGKADSQSRIYTITLSGGDNAVPMNVKANMDTALLKIEETGNIELSGYLSDGNEFDVYLASLSFKSLDESIATVNESGEVTGVAEGKTKIIVSVTKNGSTFDAEAEVNVSLEKLAFSDYSLKYDFGYEIKDTTPFLSITGDETKNIWLPHSISSKISTLRKMSYGLQVGTVKDQYIVMTLNVPTSGTFRTKFGYALNSSGGSGEVYLLDGNTTDIAKAILNTKNRLGSFNCYGASLVTGQSVNFRNVTFEKAGKYLLVLRASGVGDGMGNGKSNNLYPSSITFYGGEEKAVAGIVAEKKELLLEEGLAEKIDASVYLSDCTKASEEDYTIEYNCADDSIATVDENGVVTAVSAGDTEVTITAKRGESSTNCVVRVSVIKPGYSAYRTEYDFSDADTDANGVIALEINVPATGSCDIILNHDKKPSGGVGEVYIMSADTEDVLSALTEENKVGEADYFAETEENVDTPLGKYTFKMQGKYLVVLKTRETGVAQYPKKLILDGGSRAALMSVTLSFNGRNAKVVSGKMSDGTDADLSGAEISYGIKDLSVGSIDAKTGLVTATAEGGKTSITAVATLDGITVLGMLDVTLEGETLVPSGVSREYVLNEYSSDWTPVYSTTAYDMRGITYEHTYNNWSWFGMGPNDLTSSRASLALSLTGTNANRVRIQLRQNEWLAMRINVPVAGTYWADIVSAKYADADHGTGDIYVIPVKDTTADVTNALGQNSYLGTINFNDKSLSAWKQTSDALGPVTFEAAGEYLLVFKQPYDNAAKYLTPRIFSIDGTNAFRFLNLNLNKTVFEVGETGSSEFVARLLDGTEITGDVAGIVYSSDDESVATFEDGVLKAVGQGRTKVNVTVIYDGNQVKASSDVIVNETSGIDTIAISADEWGFAGEKIKLSSSIVYKNGNTSKLDDSKVTYTVLDGSAEIIDDTYVVASSVGDVSVKVSTTIAGVAYESEPVLIAIREGTTKTASTYYTTERCEAVRENAKKYDWAKDSYDSALKSADVYVDRAEHIYNRMTGEGIPRSQRVGSEDDPEYMFCRYCGVNTVEKYGSGSTGGYDVNIYTRPWKIQCKECKRFFPSNDFELLYERGVDEKGYYNRDRAVAANAEAVANGEKDALHNDLYPELYNPTSELYNKDPRTGDAVDGATWAVDDGLGYLPGRTYSNGAEERHGYIAYYMHSFWLEANTAVANLSRAYAYSGDMKYGRAGAILIDRIADLYPSFSYKQWDTMYLVAHGGTGFGKIFGHINDTTTSTTWIQSADAFFPVYSDPQVVSFLSEKAAERGLDNPKTSGEKIWSNIEDGLIFETFESCKEGTIHGNYGMKQASLAAAALVLDREPYSSEIVDWIYQPGSWYQLGNTAKSDGGNLSIHYVDVIDRDGMGNETGPGYNFVGVNYGYKIAEMLEMYSSDEKYNLYKNPKFAKMFTAYEPVALADTHSAQIGDSGWTANVEFEDYISVIIRGFQSLKDTNLGNKLAEYIYRRNGYTVEGLYYDIFTKNPESIQQDILERIDDDVNAKSDMMPAYGFAVLREGAAYGDKVTNTYENNMRDFWIYFGETDGHGHNDALNIGMEAFGLNFAPDNGVPEAKSSSDQNRFQWVESTLAHNTVTVNEKIQKPIGNTVGTKHGFPMHFDDSGDVKLLDVDTPLAYDATSIYRRTAVMINVGDDNSYVVDFFRVKGGNDHIYSFHSQSDEIFATEGLDGITYQTDDGTASGNYVGSYAGRDVPFGNDPSESTSEAKFTYPAGYTWMKNVRKASDVGKFTVDFKVTDFNKVLKNGKGLHLKMTMLNDFDLNEVSLTSGHVIATNANINMPETFEYVLARRKGNNLDSLFTTVFEPYRDTPYIADSYVIDDISVKSGAEKENDAVKALKVVRKDGRCDYIVYATNKNVVYTIKDEDVSFDFSGFVGVYSINKDKILVYSYVNDGSVIGENTDLCEAYTGSVSDFTKELAFENSIVLSSKDNIDASILSGKFVYVENDGVNNAVYKIEDAELVEGGVKLDIGAVTTIRSFKDANDTSKGYVYNIAKGQRASIPISNIVDNAPVFEKVSDGTASAGSIFTDAVLATSADGVKITYIGKVLPRGASVDENTGTISWKPTSGQVGKNHFAITAKDELGRENTVHFIVNVYGSTTSGTNSSASGNGGGDAKPSTPDEPAKPEVETPDVPEATARFTDLGNHAWAESAINALADEGIIKGTSETTFSPGNNITRADFAILLVRAFGLSSDNTENFADVSDSDYFAKELAIARNTGIVNGIGDNKYAPRNTITRQDMMVIVYRAMQKLGAELEIADVEYADFRDVADYAKDAVSALVGAGLVNGKNGKIAPTDYTTRAEVAVLIKRIIDYK
ncbi:MAG: S-layer homology domain-containing protein [Oscillospiraceae bacterium]|nr:S-layer homology domain-containing protein [Oscillospiraceae bacterium]